MPFHCTPLQTDVSRKEKQHKTLRTHTIAPILAQIIKCDGQPVRPLSAANGIKVDLMTTRDIEDIFWKLTGEDLKRLFRFIAIDYSLEKQKMAMDYTIEYTLMKVNISSQQQLH